MPYLPPAAVDAPRARYHRRSSSASSDPRFSSEAGPGAFAPMPALPRRQTGPPKQPASSVPPAPSPAPTPTRRVTERMFQLPSDTDSSSSSDEEDDVRPDPAAASLKIDVSPATLRPTPPTGAVQHSHSSSSIPFPRGPSSARSPSPTPTPVVLSNGKPLKPSLKSSHSSSSIFQQLPSHVRAQSAPSTPSTAPPAPHKNVHFAEKESGLESVRLFHHSNKPLAVSRDDIETETETEGYDSAATTTTTSAKGTGGVKENTANNGAAYPFPSFPFVKSTQAPPVALAPPPHTSRVPSPAVLPSPGAPRPHVVLTRLELSPSPPYALRGTVLVLNVSFEKTVSVRFTFDDWATVSEVGASYERSDAHLPSGSGGAQYDAFAFAVSLHDLYLSRVLPQRTLYLCVRYAAPGGEWWDNNAGANYRVSFAPSPHVLPQRPAMGRSLSSPAYGNTAAPVQPQRKWESVPKWKANREEEEDEEAPPNQVFEQALGRIARGTGFSSFSLPRFTGKTRSAPNVSAPPPPPAPPADGPTSPYASTKLKLRNYASPTTSLSPPPSRSPSVGSSSAPLPPAPAPAPEKSEPRNLPTPPASRSSSLTDMPTALVNGHFASAAPDPAPAPRAASQATREYEELLAKWCFHQSDPVASSSASSLSVGVEVG